MAGEIGDKKPILTSQPSQNTRRPRFFRFVVGAFIALFVFIAGVILWQAYDIWKVQNQAAYTVQALKNYEEDQYRKALADTYGGKTPQETLQMYIEAVEKGDYELASKYFILDYQDKELKSLKSSPPENIRNVLNLLNQTILNKGSYSWDGKEFGIREPLSADFKLYPSGIWKIVEK
ncbi:MAG: hypothetical protein UY23_C0001G0038 [Candidatus Jorgensenbacteria bacterium GW2011_GWA1_48_11]|uniref:DUF4878 domain-containing protein n=1 Tax=Candidatus Jorgensenbacteria bacterium GW2011_GWA1_48_11 TaxID=1618660 RepID=A0A0G1UBE0_9BACT|nr:MAG: hypothetical protein UY23_C0001G0038 [Candidatus Jorgensenbacteria bacterium GW2011_GWA1_48_11]KKW11926.1 MAG: hypothetical protein UY51_C0005G0168 [Candidatus Jorgensenbacteria bacterium GW2011_GWB1_49_9]